MVDVPEKPIEVAGAGAEVLAHEETSEEADKKTYEQLPESKEQFLETEVSQELPVAAITAPAEPVTQLPATEEELEKDPTFIKVEKILEDGMGDLYASLPPEAQTVFKQRGQQAAEEIFKMVQTLKLQLARVVRLIRGWLLTIPKVNRFYLEQQAKIKTDQIVELAEARRKELQNQTHV